MAYLFLDTARASETLGMTGTTAGFSTSRWPTTRDLSARITGFCDEMLKDVGLTVSDLDALAVGTGPGSLTGLRVAVAFLRTLAWIHGLPLIGIDRFSWARETLWEQGFRGEFNMILPAFLDRVFLVSGNLSPASRDNPLTPALHRRAELPATGHTFDLDLPDQEWQNPAALHRLIMREAAAGNHDLLAVRPLYVVPSQAELRFSGEVC